MNVAQRRSILCGVLAMACLLGNNAMCAQTSPELIPFLKGTLFGFVDKNKRMVINPQFMHAYPFGYSYDGNFFPDVALVQKGETMYLVDKQGKLVEQEIFNKQNGGEVLEAMRARSYQYNAFEENGKKGVKGEKNEIVIKPEYDRVDIYYLSGQYFNEASGSFFSPTFATTWTGGERKLIRIDKYQVYENIAIDFYDSEFNYLIVKAKSGDKPVQYGVLTPDKLLLVDPKYRKVIQFYKNQGLMEVYKIIGDHPVSIYVDIDGNEYYEQ